MQTGEGDGDGARAASGKVGVESHQKTEGGEGIWREEEGDPGEGQGGKEMRRHQGLGTRGRENREETQRGENRILIVKLDEHETRKKVSEYDESDTSDS